MELKDIIALTIGGIILIGVIVYLVVNQKKKIIEWLKWAVVEAEKALGSGTGQLKLRQVYDWFCQQFSFIAAILPFKVFSAWVKVALKTLDDWLDNNKDISAYITGGGSNDSKSN
jgi:hypothetical protein